MIAYVGSQFRRRYWRSLGVVAAVAIGAILFVVLSAMGAGFREAARAPLADVSADVVISRTVAKPGATTVAPKARGARLPFGLAAMDGGDIAAIRSTDGVASTARALQIWDFGGNSYVDVLGVDTDRPAGQAPIGPGAALASDLMEGRSFAAGDRGVAVADLHYARFYELKPGATVTVDGTSFTLIGIVEMKNGSQAAAANLYIPLADAQQLVGLGSEAIDQVYVKVANAGRVDLVVADLTAKLGDVSVMTEDSLLQVMGGVGQVSARFSLVAALVGLLGGLFLAWAALTGLVAERRVEIGVMKAVGWRRRDVTRSFLVEGSLLSLAGGVIGFFVGWAVALVLGQVPLPTAASTADQAVAGMAVVSVSAGAQSIPPQVDAVLLVVAIVASIAGGTFAAWLSARRAASLKPATTLRSR